MKNLSPQVRAISNGAAIDNNDNNELTSLEIARTHPNANASSFPLNHIAQILFSTTTGRNSNAHGVPENIHTTPTEGIWGLNPPPLHLEIPVLVHTFHLKFRLLRCCFASPVEWHGHFQGTLNNECRIQIEIIKTSHKLNCGRNSSLMVSARHVSASLQPGDCINGYCRI